MALKSVASYCSRVAQTATDFADASHSKSAKSVTTTVSYGIFSSENAYPCTVTISLPSMASVMAAVLGGAFIMFRMWGKIIKDNHLVKDTTICISDYSLSRTQMVFQSLDDICYEFDLSKPIWLDSNIHDFQLHAKTRFGQDQFIEHIEFDYLEIQVIEE